MPSNEITEPLLMNVLIRHDVKETVPPPLTTMKGFDATLGMDVEPAVTTTYSITTLPVFEREINVSIAVSS
jgi:hypothetical protein